MQLQKSYEELLTENKKLKETDNYVYNEISELLKKKKFKKAIELSESFPKRFPASNLAPKVNQLEKKSKTELEKILKDSDKQYTTMLNQILSKPVKPIVDLAIASFLKPGLNGVSPYPTT